MALFVGLILSCLFPWLGLFDTLDCWVSCRNSLGRISMQDDNMLAFLVVIEVHRIAINLYI